MKAEADTSIVLKTTDGQIVYPHATKLVGADGRTYMVDHWHAHGTVYVVEEGKTHRLAKSIDFFGLTIAKREPIAEDLVRIPVRFLDDHEERALPTPVEHRRTKTYSWIKRDDPALGELIDDARYYAHRDGPDCGPNLRPSALALLKALGVKP